MNIRICILAATAVAALGGPAAQFANAMIPADGVGYGYSTEAGRHPLASQPAVKGKKSQKLDTSIKLGHYNKHAYVHGGASQKVANAITAAGKASTATEKASATAGRWTFP